MLNDTLSKMQFNNMIKNKKLSKLPKALSTYWNRLKIRHM